MLVVVVVVMVVVVVVGRSWDVDDDGHEVVHVVAGEGALDLGLGGELGWDPLLPVLGSDEVVVEGGGLLGVGLGRVLSAAGDELAVGDLDGGGGVEDDLPGGGEDDVHVTAEGHVEDAVELREQRQGHVAVLGELASEVGVVYQVVVAEVVL